jgi:hypothetical protein
MNPTVHLPKQPALDLTLSTSTFLVATTAIHAANTAGIVVWLLIFLWARAARAA